MPAQGPLIPRRRLGAELRRLRESAGLHLEDAAERLECSTSKISRLETGQGIPKSRDVRDLLSLYGVDDQRAVERLLRWAGDGKRQAWWQDLSDVMSTNLGAYISLESESSRMRVFGGSYVYSLFQTPQYAEAMFRDCFPRADDDSIDGRVRLREERKAQMSARDEQPRIDVILEEAVLRRAVGSPKVMAAQLERLIEVDSEHDRSLRIYPFSAGADLGIQCTFVVFTFESDFDRNAVNLELSGGDRWLEQDADVARYTRIFDTLTSKSLSESESVTMIKKIMSEYRDQ
ncbi:Putative DNA-binding protein [Alloactinosynnema sp. L-07]|uniref:helix-turn-helix domain-containing protein n=1 Tax=Alloactinosynnema sp. L-07 TaxID=1653480 RepID=UPI00065EF1A0|nr:helix-turn-helix transcriptional regulator [Alloactinosynnema sp. L-07]CRK59596.1 Putative DNA-binding protein [Alloactinosynnema sp. L-07]